MKEAIHFRLQQLNILTAGGVSVEDRSNRTETVRPQWGGTVRKQPESDSALSATSDESDIELNGETDEDMEERRDSMTRT